MPHYQRLIVGGGMTAAAAMDGIRDGDPTGAVGLISAELDAPYDRPPLSKALWKDAALDSIWGKTKDKRFTLHSGRVIKEILPRQQRVLDDKGQRFTYHTLLSTTLIDTGQRFGVIGGGVNESEIAAALAPMKARW